MAIGYRSVFRVGDEKDAEAFIEDHLRSWLEVKKSKKNSRMTTATWDGPGIHDLGEDISLRVVHKRVDEDGSELRLYRLTETNPGGTFDVSIYVIASGELSTSGPNVVIDVSNPAYSPSDAIMEIATPNLVSQILDSARIFDSRARLTGSPIVITERNSHLLIDAISDPERTVSVVVGASPASDADVAWCEVAESLTKQAVGTAAIFVVEADAVADIDTELGEAHAVGRGRFRTYAPRVALGSDDDSVRHTWLGPATLARSLRTNPSIRVERPLPHVYASTPRRRLIERELPSKMTIAMALLHRAERVMLRRVSADRTVAEILEQPPAAPRTPAPAAPSTQARPEPAHPPARQPVPDIESLVVESDGFVRSFVTRIRSLVEKWLPRFRTDVSDVENLSDLERLLVRMGAEMEAIEEQMLELEIANEELQKELLETRSDLDDYEEEITGLRNHNVDLNDLYVITAREIAARNIEVDYSVMAEWEVPESMVELVARLSPGEQPHPAQRFVQFTGSPDGAEQMDDRYPLSQYTKLIWSYVRALHDYAEQKSEGFEGDFHMYLHSPVVAGRKCIPDQYAPTESQTVRTRPKFRKPRMLPVPPEVDPSELVFMEAHFTPVHTDSFAPRVHFYDDTSGPTGQIYIGYIGRHLPNTKTINM